MKQRRLLIRALSALAIILAILVSTGIGMILESKSYIFKSIKTTDTAIIEPFPVGVNVATKTIIEQPAAEVWSSDTLAHQTTPSVWQQFIAAFFMNNRWYQNLASPISRIVVIWPGERYEQIAKTFKDILGWTDEEQQTFVSLIQSTEPILAEGKFLPGSYVTHRYATPEEVAALIQTDFTQSILSRYTPAVAAQVPLEDALTIASLIQREASDFENMREVSGVIWNRLFIDMPLQLDATLQYARGSRPTEPHWWPVPRPRDKFIDSPYNTYLYKGLPPGPIANPSVEAVIAALNPRKTDCLFYFHADNGDYYCSRSYEEHVTQLRAVFGRGS